MGINIGIVGLPNVGKSTLFSAITKSSVEIANYPFATIEPNVGVIEIKDERISFLESIYKPKKVIYNWIKFVDIAGLVKGASEGKGLGNKFLSNIREVDAICEVVRCFENKDILHVEGRINPLDDLKIISFELILSDIETVNNAIQKIERKAKNTTDKEITSKYEAFLKVRKILEDERLVWGNQFSEEEETHIKTLSLLTNKPKFFVINVHEDNWTNLETMKEYVELTNYLKSNNFSYVPAVLKFEHELLAMELEEDKTLFMEEYGMKESSFPKIIAKAFELLDLQTFYTCGPQEVHAWTFTRGMTAKECAGRIHTDIEKGFIKGEIFNLKDLIENNDPKTLKEKGLIKIEGKDYKVKDGDICYFHFKK